MMHPVNAAEIVRWKKKRRFVPLLAGERFTFEDTAASGGEIPQRKPFILLNQIGRKIPELARALVGHKSPHCTPALVEWLGRLVLGQAVPEWHEEIPLGIALGKWLLPPYPITSLEHEVQLDPICIDVERGMIVLGDVYKTADLLKCCAEICAVFRKLGYKASFRK